VPYYSQDKRLGLIWAVNWSWADLVSIEIANGWHRIGARHRWLYLTTLENPPAALARSLSLSLVPTLPASDGPGDRARGAALPRAF
jgi:hypothetical protein